jgi:hypothetical protein
MEVSAQLYSQAALPQRKTPPVPIGWEAGQAPDRVWTLRSIEKYLAPAGRSWSSFENSQNVFNEKKFLKTRTTLNDIPAS